MNETKKEINLKESRELKKSFANYAKENWPSINNAYYVHWISLEYSEHEDDPISWLFNNKLLERISYIKSRKSEETPCNLLDPSGKDISPHLGSWGPIGIIVQGHVTFGSDKDLMSDVMGTKSGKRRFYDDWNTSPEEENVFSKGRFLKNINNGFLKHNSNFKYSRSEFFVKVTKIVGLMVWPPTQNKNAWGNVLAKPKYKSLSDNIIDSLIESEITKMENKLSIPIAFGRSEIRFLCKSLYSISLKENNIRLAVKNIIISEGARTVSDLEAG